MFYATNGLRNISAKKYQHLQKFVCLIAPESGLRKWCTLAPTPGIEPGAMIEVCDQLREVEREARNNFKLLLRDVLLQLEVKETFYRNFNVSLDEGEV